MRTRRIRQRKKVKRIHAKDGRKNKIKNEMFLKKKVGYLSSTEAERQVHINDLKNKIEDIDMLLHTVMARDSNEQEILEQVNMLLGKGADPYYRDELDNSVLDIAIKRRLLRVIRVLLDDMMNRSAFNNGKKPYLTGHFNKALDDNDDVLASLITSYMTNDSVRELFSPKGEEKEPRRSIHSLLKSEKMEKTTLAVLDCLIDRQDNAGNAKVYFQPLEDRSSTDEHSLTAFQMIAKKGRKTIVNHNVVRLLIYRKWKRYARNIFFLCAALYMFALACMTYAAITAAMTDDPLLYQGTRHTIRAVCEIVVVVSAIISLMFEILHIQKLRRDYLRIKFNYVDLLAVLFILILISLRVTANQNQWQIYSVVFLLWVLRLFKYAVVSRETGAYIRVLADIIYHDFIRFMVVFAAVLLGFSGTLLLALRGEDQAVKTEHTSSFWSLLFLGLRILYESEKIIDYTKLDAWSCILMILFLFSCIILLLNLLIAQLSDTYSFIKNDARRSLEVSRAWIIAKMELGLWQIIKKWTQLDSTYSDNIDKVLEKSAPQSSEIMQLCLQAVEKQSQQLQCIRTTLTRQRIVLSEIQEQMKTQDCEKKPGRYHLLGREPLKTKDVIRKPAHHQPVESFEYKRVTSEDSSFGNQAITLMFYDEDYPLPDGEDKKERSKLA